MYILIFSSHLSQGLQNVSRYLGEKNLPSMHVSCPTYLIPLDLFTRITPCSGPGSSVGIVTNYGLDGPGSNLSGDEIFRPSRPALGPTQPPVKWVPGLSRG